MLENASEVAPDEIDIEMLDEAADSAEQGYILKEDYEAKREVMTHCL